MTAKAPRASQRILAVPVSYQARTEGWDISLRDGFSALRTLIRYRFRK